MARVTLVDANTHPHLAEQIAHVTGARQGRLINVYRLLLNSPSLATAWVDFNNAVRLGSALDARTVELTALIGAYNMHSRVGRALKIDLEQSWDLSAARWR